MDRQYRGLVRSKSARSEPLSIGLKQPAADEAAIGRPQALSAWLMLMMMFGLQEFYLAYKVLLRHLL